jgi:hypothetical protein
MAESAASEPTRPPLTEEQRRAFAEVQVVLEEPRHPRAEDARWLRDNPEVKELHRRVKLRRRRREQIDCARVVVHLVLLCLAGAAGLGTVYWLLRWWFSAGDTSAHA